MLIEIFLPLLMGGALLAGGGEALVRGSAGTARRLGLAPVVIGVLLIGFGTSTPELLTSVEAARLGAPDIALGNALGSNTCNVLLIGGLAAIIAPMTVHKDAFRFDLWIAVTVAVTLALAMVAGPLTPMLGALFLLSLAVYALVALSVGASSAGGPQDTGAHRDEIAPVLWRSLAIALVGLVAALLGARLFVEGAVEIARLFDVSEAVIGASIVAVGTSLPELATSIMAARRGQSELALGNIIGSNIFNILGVIGATLMVGEIAPSSEALLRDLPAMLAATVALVVVILVLGRMSRAIGIALLAGYGLYLAVML